MKKIYIFLLCFMLGNVHLNAQCTVPPQQNLNKYWEYRERLKDFVVQGTCMGCSMPSQDRSSAQLSYNDSPSFLGYYIGVVATEWYLLGGATDTASINQKQRDVAELYYAVNEVYSLDILAKVSWYNWYSGIGVSPSPSLLDGFIIRDNVPAYFPDTIVNNDYVSNYLSKSLSPVPDYVPGIKPNNWYDPQVIGSDWVGTQGKTGSFSVVPFTSCHKENNKLSGVNPISQDEYCQLMIGFALVSKYIPSTLMYNGQSIEGMVQDEQTKIFNNIKNNGWLLENTVTHHCNTGVNWTTPSINNIFDLCKCDESGSDISGTIGLGLDGITYTNYAIANKCASYNTSLAGPKWLFIYPFFYLSGASEYIMLSEATIGKIWGGSTPSIINKCVKLGLKFNDGKCTIYPLLYEALWGGNVSIFPEQYYKQLLSCAPCHGVPPGGGNNYEWSSGNRMYIGTGYYTYSSVYSSLDYLLYFNLFNIAEPIVYSNSYVNYLYVNPKDLRYPYLQKQTHTETYEKNFWASDSVAAGNFDTTSNAKTDTINNYTIANANNPNESLFQGRAQVSFRAGNRIDMLPGFEAQEGVLFDAAIDTTIHTMNCVDCGNPGNLDSIYGAPDTNYNGDNIAYFSTDSLIEDVHCSCFTLHLFGINGDTAGIRSWNWDFGNGQTSTVYNPIVTYCPPHDIDSAATASTGLLTRDTTYLLTLIVQDSGGYFDTIHAFMYVKCGEEAKGVHNPQPNIISDTLKDITTFKILNNLTTDYTTIQYSIPQQTTVNINVYNMMGINCGTLVNNVIEGAGTYTIPLYVTNFTAGMYFVAMQAGNFVQTKKFVVLKRN